MLLGDIAVGADSVSLVLQVPPQLGGIFSALLLLDRAVGDEPAALQGAVGPTMSINLLALISATLTIATPLVWAAIGEVIIEKTGVLNLGIEGTMYVGAFVGFLVALRSGSPWLGLLTAVLAGVLAGR